MTPRWSCNTYEKIISSLGKLIYLHFRSYFNSWKITVRLSARFFSCAETRLLWFSFLRFVTGSIEDDSEPRLSKNPFLTPFTSVAALRYALYSVSGSNGAFTNLPYVFPSSRTNPFRNRLFISLKYGSDVKLFSICLCLTVAKDIV